MYIILLVQRRQLTKNQYRWLGVFLVFIIGVVYYVSWSRVTKTVALNENLRAEEKVVAAQSANIDSFFRVFGGAIAIFAQTPYLGDSNTQTYLDAFMEQWEGTGVVQGILYTDTEGTVLYNSDITETSQVGESIASRDYFLWAKDIAKHGEYRVAVPVASNVFGNFEGTAIVPVIVPVYQRDILVGTVTAAVNLSSLVDSYLGITDITAYKDVILVTQQGNLVYSDIPTQSHLQDVLLVDHNPFERDNVLETRVENILFATQTGSLHTTQHLLAYSPLTVGENRWLVISISDRTSELSHTKPILIQYSAIFLFVVFTTILIFAFSVRGFPIRVELTETPEEKKK